MLSREQQDEIYIMNPLTRRSIVIGGRVYNQLIKKGVIKPREEVIKKKVIPLVVDKEKDNKKRENNLKQEELPELNKLEELEESKLEELVDQLSEQKIDSNELSEIIAKASKNVMEKHKDELSEITNDDKLYDEVKYLIDEELKLLLYT